MCERETDIVKRFYNSKCYGFLDRDAGGEVFVHFSAISGDEFRSLADVQWVDSAFIGKWKEMQAQEVISVE